MTISKSPCSGAPQNTAWPKLLVPQKYPPLILSPDQRRTFDALASLHEMGGMGHEHGMGGMGHGPIGGDHRE